MGATVYTGGTNNVGATIKLLNAPSGKVVTAWRQGVPYACSYVSGEYVATVPFYGTYTFTMQGATGQYKDVFVYSGGTFGVSW